MIYRLTFDWDPATLSQLRKKKLCCVSVLRTVTDATCKLKNDDWFEMIYFLRFDGENFETVASSKYNHDFTGLANYGGSPLTTGSRNYFGFFVETEIYNFETNRWNDAPDYPFSS